MMKAYRIYLGARNSMNHRFDSHDLNILTSILNHHFEGWSIYDSLGTWQGQQEEGKVITIFIDSGASSIPKPIRSCMEDLLKAFNQYTLFIEEGGTAKCFQLKESPSLETSTLSPVSI
ncbi:MAG: hypothetical protein V4507_12835 [Verrucomicrobiota bacterium]